MRLFQNSGLYPSYRPRLEKLASATSTFQERINVFLDDRFGASHFLKPVLDRDPAAFFTNADDRNAQRLWAKAAGMPNNSSTDDILLAQIEQHRTEVFYNMDPMRFQREFLVRLPGCVRKTVAWRAAPSPGADFSRYGLVVCNFPSILEKFQRDGCNTALFWPAHDPAMDAYATNVDRPIDVLFVGGYTRHHRKRAELLEALSALDGEYEIAMHLDRSRLTRIAEAVPSWVPGLSQHRRPDAIQRVSRAPVFGLDLYRLLSRAKIVLNGAIDMAGTDRGNMRCFESMGCGCALLSDAGNYPEGMTPGSTLNTYSSTTDAIARVNAMLADAPATAALAESGRIMISQRYSKLRQWERFVVLAQ